MYGVEKRGNRSSVTYLSHSSLTITSRMLENKISKFVKIKDSNFGPSINNKLPTYLV